METSQPQPRLAGLGAGLAGTASMLAVFAYVLWIEGSHADFYYRSVQEDEHLEWATFWGFALAGLAYARAALAQWRTGTRLPWFAAGLAAFCLAVAMEEISWGQRVFGYRPPAYFLEHNYQQELNVHNVVDSRLRQDAFVALIALFGLVLPALGLVPAVARRLARVAIVPPPPGLVPGFGLAIALYLEYPWRFTGEIVELAVSFGFLGAGVAAALPASASASGGGRVAARRQAGAVAAALLLALGLGVAAAAASRVQRSASPETLRSAQRELEALERDFRAQAAGHDGALPVRCGLHKRLYTYVEQYEQRFLERGEFAGLVARGLPEERAAFFIDPWNSPYWLRSRCSDDRTRRSVFLYSFGPNRLRDSSHWRIRDDDVGTYLLRQGFDDAAGVPGEDDRRSRGDRPAPARRDPSPDPALVPGAQRRRLAP